jgi:hypothetical protein
MRIARSLQVVCPLALSGLFALVGFGGCAAEVSPEPSPSEEQAPSQQPADGEETTGEAADALNGPVCQVAAAGRYCGNDDISGGSAGTLYSCPGGANKTATVSKVCPVGAGCHVSSPGVNDYCNCETATNCSDCVFYARCRKPSLPTGLNTLAQKMAIKNSNTASVGEVAIIDVGTTTGHLAYVEAVSGSTITLSEGNYTAGVCGQRSGTASSLHIVGYYK